MVSNTRIADSRRILVALLTCAALLAGRAAQAQDEVRIDLEAGGDRKIGILVESFVPVGDRGMARPKAIEADAILANDLENSTVFAVARSWDATGASPQGVTAVVSATLTVKGTAVTLSGRLADFPARRLIAKSEYRGTIGELRRLVHRFADDVILQLTGEAGVAQTQIAFVSKAAKSSELWAVDVDGYGARALTAFKAPITSPSWSPHRADVVFSSLRGAGWNLYAVPYRGGASRQITHAGTLNIAPAWSPDGGSVAYVSNKDGNSEIYVANADGSAHPWPLLE